MRRPHAPGPWTRSVGLRSVTRGFWTSQVHDRAGVLVATVRGCPSDAAEANARLVAAAPELLDALTEVLKLGGAPCSCSEFALPCHPCKVRGAAHRLRARIVEAQS